MQLTPIIDRLKADLTSLGVQQFGGVADFSSLQKAGLRQTPAIFIMDVSSQAKEAERGAIAVKQRVNHVFAVMIVVSNLRDAQGFGAHDAGLEPLRQGIQASLQGWQPAAAYTPCIYANGKLINGSNGNIWWAESYKTSTWINI